MIKLSQKIIIISGLVLMLTSCATPIAKKPPVNAPSDDASIKLAEAAGSISDSMIEMAKIEKVLLPKAQDNVVNIPSSYNLQTRANIDWVGPVEELTKRIANAAHYRLRVLGYAPTVPILINMSIKDQSLAEILRNIDYQLGNRGNIHVYPQNQVIELRYVKFYS
jgi:defect-in-organelle-trafficking protein DotD